MSNSMKEFYMAKNINRKAMVAAQVALAHFKLTGEELLADLHNIAMWMVIGMDLSVAIERQMLTEADRGDFEWYDKDFYERERYLVALWYAWQSGVEAMDDESIAYLCCVHQSSYESWFEICIEQLREATVDELEEMCTALGWTIACSDTCIVRLALPGEKFSRDKQSAQYAYDEDSGMVVC